MEGQFGFVGSERASERMKADCYDHLTIRPGVKGDGGIRGGMNRNWSQVL